MKPPYIYEVIRDDKRIVQHIRKSIFHTVCGAGPIEPPKWSGRCDDPKLVACIECYQR